MAAQKTAKKTTAKKTASKKTTAKKTTAEKTASKATAAERPAAGDVAARVDELVDTVVRYSRDAAHTYVGLPLVVQDRVARRSLTTEQAYANVLDEAKARGHERAVAVQARVEPLVQRVNAVVEPITGRIESRFPAPVQDALETGRRRARELLSA